MHVIINESITIRFFSAQILEVRKFILYFCLWLRICFLS